MNKVSLLMFSFVVAFNTLVLEFSMASFVTNILSGEIFLYPFVMILYLFGMGCGAYNQRNVDSNEVSKLVKIESVLAILIWLGFIGLNLLARHSPILFIPFLTITILIQGFLIGQELPLIFSLSKKQNFDLNRKIIAVDYFASLIATLVFIFIIIPYVSFFHCFWALCCFSLCSILFIDQNQRNYFMIVALTITIPMIYNLDQYNEDRFNLTEDEYILTHFKTKHQEVTVIAKQLKNHESVSESIILKNKNDFVIKAYLNNIYQFQVNLNYPHDQYHYEMIHPIVKTFPHIKNILILGGGDGLPAKELLNFDSQIQRIDIIDIDSKWFFFSKNNLLMKEVNSNSLNHKKVNYIEGNAFIETKKIKRKYDLILIDFPEGESLESLRIHSSEFTKQLKKLLSDDGIILSQEDTFTDTESSQLIANTLINEQLDTLYGSYNRGQEYLIQFISFKNNKLIPHFLETNKKRKIRYKQMTMDEDKEIITYNNPSIIQARIKSFIKEIAQGLIK